MKHNNELSGKYNTLYMVIILIFLSGCALPRTINFDNQTFNENFTKWKSKNISDYKFTYNSFGFSSYSIDIEVKNNQVSAYSVDNNYPFYEETLKKESKNIDGFFNEINDFYNEYNGKEYPDSEMYYTDIIVNYNKDYGYPESWYYKYHCPENLAVDGNFSHSLTKFDVTSD